MSETKIIRPKIPQWSGDFWEKNFQELLNKPTHQQLELLQQKVEDQFGKLLPLDLFALIFRTVLDNMPPDLPPITPKAHEELYSQIIATCTSFSIKWSEEFTLRMKEGFHV
ncbi:MAG: hypothetical protein ACLP5H_34225 [Desulfomonilaceae bacterium]